MEVKVKRNTGFVGRFSPITLLVDNKEVTKLRHNETYIIKANQQVKLKVRQLFLHSRERTIGEDATIEVKSNPVPLTLYFISILLVLISAFYRTGAAPFPIPIFSLVAFVCITITILYSVKSFFLLK